MSIVADGSLDIVKLNMWLGGLIQVRLSATDATHARTHARMRRMRPCWWRA